MKQLAMAVCLAAAYGSACAGLLGPANYEECVLQNLKGVGSDVAARVIAAACAEKFPRKKAPESPPPRTAPASTPAEAKGGGLTDFKPDPPK